MNVSVIMPAFNAEATIQAALDSILAQTSPPHDIIVVDDGSTDGTAAVVASYGGRIQYHWQTNAGPSAARNTGLTLATGDMIAFLDADDLWPSHSLSVLQAALQAHPEAAIAQGQMQDMWDDGQGRWLLTPPRRGVNVGGSLFRRTVFEQIGVFNPGLRRGEDTEFWVRLNENSLTPHTIDEVTLLYRRKPRQPDDVNRHLSHWLHTLKRSLDRQRAQ